MMCFGDLNDIIYNHEKKGGICKTIGQLSWGQQALDRCGLVDLGIEGYPFTWNNGRRGNENIQERLDRALVSNEFSNRFATIKVSYLPRYGSDHAVIRIELEADSNSKGRKRAHIFRFKEV